MGSCRSGESQNTFQAPLKIGEICEDLELKFIDGEERP